ncbi:Protein of uncharacterised function (DUF2785) [Lacrimispora sphenoides]|uniref:DUF2785 domain-containing protein n=1 Tax=Lacrimispora sphenoides JCM 1415 TaxID=1297793 RepID=A0ABY1CA62_9FIRM|nr:Protein of unknown function [[Clostridium] sphenoides JCM 1415]SUY51730.1 Protein of uncharacterised function (DUF2785) [Lacrimispora sphenoides]
MIYGSWGINAKGVERLNNKREQLILELRKIQENQYMVAGEQDPWDYVLQMLDHIGDTDSEFRDELIYNTFSEWIEEKESFNEEQLKYILTILMDKEHLFYQIGSDGNDSVFTRTFSALVVVLVLNRHRKKALLSIDEFIDIKDKVIEYYTSEKDLRGYVQKSEWAHAAAHGADVMDELVQCRECSEDIMKEILNAFKKILHNGTYIFHTEEDERICRVVFRIMKGNLLSNQEIINWIEELSECAGWQNNRMQYIARVNSKNFIRCLYFKTMHYDSTLDLINVLFHAEEKLNRFHKIDRELIEN